MRDYINRITGISRYHHHSQLVVARLRDSQLSRRSRVCITQVQYVGRVIDRGTGATVTVTVTVTGTLINRVRSRPGKCHVIHEEGVQAIGQTRRVKLHLDYLCQINNIRVVSKIQLHRVPLTTSDGHTEKFLCTRTNRSDLDRPTGLRPEVKTQVLSTRDIYGPTKIDTLIVQVTELQDLASLSVRLR